VACPSCGTLNPPNAKFCKKDGTALGSAAAAPAAPKVSTPIELALAPDLEPAPRAQAIPQPIEAKPVAEERRVQMAPPPAAERRAPRPVPREPEVEHKKKRSPFALIAIVLGILLAASAAGGVLYWKGMIGNRQESVAEAINVAARDQGFDAVTIDVSKDWIASVSGSVTGQVRKDELLALVRQNTNITSVTETLVVHPGADELGQQLSDALAARGFKTVTATVGPDLIATLTGTVDDPSQATVALDTARGVAGLKDVQSAIKLSVNARQTALTQALAQRGFDQVTAQVIDDNTVNVTGNVYSQEDKDKLQQLVANTTGAATVNDTTQIVERPVVVNPAQVEADINKALQKAGLSSIAAVVDEKLNATLVGTVSRASDRDRAMKTARKVTTLKALRSEIEVAGAAPTPPPAPVVKESAALSAIKGQWVGRIEGLFGSLFTLNITGGPLGQDVGISIYGAGKGTCGGTLTLNTESSPDFTFTENLDRTSLMCPGGGIIKMKVTGTGQAVFEWYRPKNPGKRYAKGVAVKK
jgi:osmotically-inducible protein OsmY